MVYLQTSYGDILLDDVKVQDAILGCTDPAFDNYDATANLDDGSCTNSYTLYMYDSYGDGWNGNEWSATGTSTGTVYGPYTLSSGSSGTATFTSSDLETLCHLVVCDNGAWQSEVSWDLQDAAGVSILAGGAPYSGTLGTCTYGCTDPAALIMTQLQILMMEVVRIHVLKLTQQKALKLALECGNKIQVMTLIGHLIRINTFIKHRSFCGI